jgi:hypothetical protein
MALRRAAEVWDSVSATCRGDACVARRTSVGKVPGEAGLAPTENTGTQEIV